MKKHWDTEYYRHAEATIERVVCLVPFFLSMHMCIARGMADRSFQYDSYWISPSSSGLAAGATSAALIAQMDPATRPPKYGMTWMHSAANEGVQAETTLAGHRQELRDYLNSSLVETEDSADVLDLIAWW
jgi:hypothetical protein